MLTDRLCANVPFRVVVGPAKVFDFLATDCIVSCMYEKTREIEQMECA